MRLTLRTLLAYLDDILDPEDTRQLQDKIEDSEFATSLVHQIRGSVRRLRLDAPALDAQGIGGDLNSVAEYLDNVLPPEQVPALEKACLDTEVHLSEVASCHQILTLVLGEPAAVSERMRQRSYAIAPTVESSELQATGLAEATQDRGEAELRVDSHAPHPGVPDPTAPPIGVPSSAKESPHPSESANAQDASSVTAEPSLPAEKSRRRFDAPNNAPSTREVWRAEARDALQAGSKTVDQELAVVAREEMAAEAAAAILPDKPVHSTPHNELPEYVDHRTSWLRSAFVTVLVALLILASLFFATQPMGGDLLSGWLGYESDWVADRKPLSPPPSPGTGEANLSATPSRQVEIVDANPSTQWVDPATSFQAAGTEMSKPPESPKPRSQPDAEPVQANLEFSVDDAIVPPLISSTRFSEESLPLAGDGTETPVGRVDNTPDGTGQEAQPQAGALPRVEPQSDLATKDATTEGHAAAIDPQPLADESPDGDFVLDANRPPKNEFSDVPPAPEDPLTNIARADGAVIPPFTADRVPIVDPGVTERGAPISPPVASPAASSTIDRTGAVSHLPVEQVSPEPMISETLEPARLKDEDQLLLVFDTQIDDWTQVDSTVPISSGDLLMSLPAFRADVEIGSSIVCTMINSTHLQLGPAADISLHQGQLLLRNVNDGEAQGVRFQGKSFEIRMPSADSLIAMAATRHHVPGTDVDELPHSLFRVYAIRNDISVIVDGEQHDLSEGSYLTAFDQYAPRVSHYSEKPTFVKSTWRTSADSNAVRVFQRNLNQSQNIRTWLGERARARRANERSLAARCLAEMDEFGAIVRALNSGDQRAYWDQHYAVLRRALTRGVDNAERLQIELEKVHGEQAGFMMEMIRGFSEAQIRGGAAAKLVKYLSAKSLANRVLAIQNLKEITGMTLAFQPEKPFKQQTASIKGWKGRLAAGEVTYKHPPEVVALLQSFVAEEDATR